MLGIRADAVLAILVLAMAPASRAGTPSCPAGFEEFESAGTWAPSAFLVPVSGTLKWPTFAPPHGRFLLRG